MNHVETEKGVFAGARERRETEVVAAGGSLAETIAGAGAIVLSILGLVGVFPDALLGVAAIAVGAAFLLESGAIASRLNSLAGQTARTTAIETGEMGAGMTVQFAGGIAGIALGVLSLLGLTPAVLLPVAAIVFGFTLLYGMGVQSRINDLEMQHNDVQELTRRVSHEAFAASSGIHALFGLGSVTLGILSLVGLAMMTLTLTAMLILGASAIFSGAAITARMWGLARFSGIAPTGARP